MVTMKKVQADLIKTRMEVQSYLFRQFLEYMKNVLITNEKLIEQQTELYRLSFSAPNENFQNRLFDKADSIVLKHAQELVECGYEKVTQLNIQGSDELKMLEGKLIAVMNTNLLESGDSSPIMIEEI